MTKKDFELIAAVIRDARLETDPRCTRDETLAWIVKEFARELNMQNTRFNKQRFIDACD